MRAFAAQTAGRGHRVRTICASRADERRRASQSARSPHPRGVRRGDCRQEIIQGARKVL